MADHTVRLHRVFTAPPDRVYRAFIDPDAMAKWLPPNGFTGRVHEMDARVGGRYRMSFTNFSTGSVTLGASRDWTVNGGTLDIDEGAVTGPTTSRLIVNNAAMEFTTGAVTLPLTLTNTSIIGGAVTVPAGQTLTLLNGGLADPVSVQAGGTLRTHGAVALGGATGFGHANDDFAGSAAALGVVLELESEHVGWAGNVQESLMQVGHCFVADEGDGGVGQVLAKMI